MTVQQVSIRTLPNFYPDTQDVYTVTVTGFETYAKQIKTVVTKDAATVDHWIEQLYSDYIEILDRAAKTRKGSWDYHRFIVALDVEWKPAAYDNQAPIAIFKLCVSSWYSSRCLIFQISRCYQLPKSLHKFLEDDNLRFVGLDIECVARKLEREFDLSVKRAVDLRDLVAENYPEKKKEVKILDLMGLAKMVLRSKEIERPRDIIVSNWNQKYLTREQIMYAAVDAYVTFQIGDELGYLMD
ncbi:hypothetical protein MKW98_023324 [Papaver atlanticum]|uniref:3'-5' exonuclease domain-containing protein n=1 Tax=Papaver atlanticum TaxID=357466 RepID=A0AAD4XVE0_9MAGN|nr:hypothetical protein MKW98_023324 [Papaver atlanticum]